MYQSQSCLPITSTQRIDESCGWRYRGCLPPLAFAVRYFQVLAQKSDPRKAMVDFALKAFLLAYIVVEE